MVATVAVIAEQQLDKEKGFDCICFSVKKMLHDQRIGDLIILINIPGRIIETWIIPLTLSRV